MKKIICLLLCPLFLCLLLACSDDNKHNENAEMELLSEKNILVACRETFTITFTSSTVWKIKCSTLDGVKKYKPDWFEVEETEGESGENTIGVKILKLNNRTNTRTGLIEIFGSGDSRLSIQIMQQSSPEVEKLVKKIIRYDADNNEIGNVEYIYCFEGFLAGGDSTVFQINNQQGNFSETIMHPSPQWIFYRSVLDGENFKQADFSPFYLKHNRLFAYSGSIKNLLDGTHDYKDKGLVYNTTGQLIRIDVIFPKLDEINFNWQNRQGIISLSNKEMTVVYNFSAAKSNNLNVDLNILIIYLFTDIDEPILLLERTGQRSPRLFSKIEDPINNSTISIEYILDTERNITQIDFTNQSGLFETWKIEYI